MKLGIEPLTRIVNPYLGENTKARVTRGSKPKQAALPWLVVLGECFSGSSLWESLIRHLLLRWIAPLPPPSPSYVLFSLLYFSTFLRCSLIFAKILYWKPSKLFSSDFHNFSWPSVFSSNLVNFSPLFSIFLIFSIKTIIFTTFLGGMHSLVLSHIALE